MNSRGSYKTKQREDIIAYLSDHKDHYFSVDSIYAALRELGSEIGRTTVYRNLELLAAEHIVFKAFSPKAEALYRLAPETNAAQLVCLSCGKAFAVDCTMVEDFTSHIKAEHGFIVNGEKTILYGTCPECLPKVKAEQAEQATDAASEADELDTTD
ncbi:Fur family transcriptional regulator [Atopobium deltae]|nr:transcriptional repressor [Atopobium deltae]